MPLHPGFLRQHITSNNDIAINSNNYHTTNLHLHAAVRQCSLLQTHHDIMQYMYKLNGITYQRNHSSIYMYIANSGGVNGI